MWSGSEALEQDEERVSLLRREAVKQVPSHLLGYGACLGAQLTSGIGEFHGMGTPVSGIRPPDGKSETFKVIDGSYHR